MKEALYLLLEYVIVYIFVFIIYYLIFVRKKTKYNPNKVPVEFYYLVGLYKLDQKCINYKKFVYAIAFINTFIIDTTYIIIYRLLDRWIWQLIVGILIIVLQIIICYGLLGRYYQKHQKVIVLDNKKDEIAKNNNASKKQKGKKTTKKGSKRDV